MVILDGLLGTSIALQLYNLQILRQFLDTAMAGNDASSLPGQALVFIILVLSTQILRALARYVGEQVNWTATNDMRADVTARFTSSHNSLAMCSATSSCGQ